MSEGLLMWFLLCSIFGGSALVLISCEEYHSRKAYRLSLPTNPRRPQEEIE